RAPALLRPRMHERQQAPPNPTPAQLGHDSDPSPTPTAIERMRPPDQRIPTHAPRCSLAGARRQPSLDPLARELATEPARRPLATTEHRLGDRLQCIE